MINNWTEIDHLLREPEGPLVSITAIVFLCMNLQYDPLRGTGEIKDEPRVKNQRKRQYTPYIQYYNGYVTKIQINFGYTSSRTSTYIL